MTHKVHLSNLGDAKVIKKIIHRLRTSFEHCSFPHQPVLLSETLTFLAPKSGDHILDGTLGLGGHAEAILPRILPGGHYYAFELDEINLNQARTRLKPFSRHITFFHDNFVHCQHRLHDIGVFKLDGILLDLGLSSPQLDDSKRGFSFQSEGPLDMRFDRMSGQSSAADLLNRLSEHELKRIFYNYGEEPYAPKLARLVLERRRQSPFETTLDLMDLIQSLFKSPGDQRKVAARVFQALRIAVNDELHVLETVLPSLLSLLSPGGRLVVLSYHSLEDRIVKNIFRQAVRLCICPPEALQCTCSRISKFRLLTKKPVVPSSEEITHNPRSRSAKLRALEKIK